jgi:hypothetical protein
MVYEGLVTFTSSARWIDHLVSINPYSLHITMSSGCEPPSLEFFDVWACASDRDRSDDHAQSEYRFGSGFSQAMTELVDAGVAASRTGRGSPGDSVVARSRFNVSALM